MSRKASPDGMRRGSARTWSCGANSLARTIGPGDEVREERHVERQLVEAQGPELAATDVDHVADGVEREERDAHRQRDLEQRRAHAEADAVERVADAVDEEPVVLEPPEQREVDDHRQLARGSWTAAFARRRRASERKVAAPRAQLQTIEKASSHTKRMSA